MLLQNFTAKVPILLVLTSLVTSCGDNEVEKKQNPLQQPENTAELTLDQSDIASINQLAQDLPFAVVSRVQMTGDQISEEEIRYIHMENELDLDAPREEFVKSLTQLFQDSPSAKNPFEKLKDDSQVDIASNPYYHSTFGMNGGGYTFPYYYGLNQLRNPITTHTYTIPGETVAPQPPVTQPPVTQPSAPVRAPIPYWQGGYRYRSLEQWQRSYNYIPYPGMNYPGLLYMYSPSYNERGYRYQEADYYYRLMFR